PDQIYLSNWDLFGNIFSKLAIMSFFSCLKFVISSLSFKQINLCFCLRMARIAFWSLFPKIKFLPILPLFTKLLDASCQNLKIYWVTSCLSLNLWVLVKCRISCSFSQTV